MSAQERFPPRIPAQVDRDHAQSVFGVAVVHRPIRLEAKLLGYATRHRRVDYPAPFGLDQARSLRNWDMSTILNRFCNGIS